MMLDDQRVSPNLRLDGARNFRDLGGYRTEDGGRVRSGRLFRSDNLSSITDADLRTLEDIGVRTVVDFRPPFEVTTFGPDRLPASAELVSLPITAGGMDTQTHEALRGGDLTALPDLVTTNRGLVRENTDQLGVLLRIAADPERVPLVFHCIGGKDRTGVAAALLLTTLGVSWEDVRRDYLLTNDYLDIDVRAQLTHLARSTGFSNLDDDDSVMATARRFFVIEPQYIDAARDEMIRMAGSVAEYVRHQLGVPDTTVQRLRHLHIDDSPSPVHANHHHTEPAP